MLSPNEYNKLLDQLDFVKNHFTGSKRTNIEKEIKKKLKEYDYATRFTPFSPLPYELVFVNRATSTETLTRLINLIDCSTLFTLDTESVNIKFQSNKPSLIQLQVLQYEKSSTIIFIETCHLPRPDHHQFTLIKQLFDVLLQTTKIIFVWGELNELDEFTRYDLFSIDQIKLPQRMNVQRRFRTYWSDNYPHQSTSSNDTSSCKCLHCFGITHDNLISLQDAVAITLHRWIDKRLTRYPFDIGLDPRLRRSNDKELEYRQSMSNYAAYDCDAIAQIINYTNIIEEIQLPIEPQPTTFSNNESSTIDSPINIFVELSEKISIEQSPTQNEAHEPLVGFELEPISDDDDDNMIISSPSKSNRIVTITKHQHTTALTPIERKKLHNRSCTLRQRRRLYQHKISCYDIDPRFSIRKIKQMLDENHINFTAVNTVRSNSTNKTTLYIGVKDLSSVHEHEPLLRTIFNTRNYNRIYKTNYNFTSTTKHHSSKRR